MHLVQVDSSLRLLVRRIRNHVLEVQVHDHRLLSPVRRKGIEQALRAVQCPENLKPRKRLRYGVARALDSDTNQTKPTLADKANMGKRHTFATSSSVRGLSVNLSWWLILPMYDRTLASAICTICRRFILTINSASSRSPRGCHLKKRVNSWPVSVAQSAKMSGS